MDYTTFCEFLTVVDGHVNYDFGNGLKRSHIFHLKANIDVFRRVKKLAQPDDAIIFTVLDKARLFDRNRVLHSIFYKLYIKYHEGVVSLICIYNAKSCNSCHYKHHNNAGSFEVRIVDLIVVWSTLGLSHINAEVITTLCAPIQTLYKLFMKTRALKPISELEFVTLREMVTAYLENWGFICRSKKAILLYLNHYKPRHIFIPIYPDGEIEPSILLNHLPGHIVYRIKEFAMMIGIYFEFMHVLNEKGKTLI